MQITFLNSLLNTYFSTGCYREVGREFFEKRKSFFSLQEAFRQKASFSTVKEKRAGWEGGAWPGDRGVRVRSS